VVPPPVNVGIDNQKLASGIEFQRPEPRDTRVSGGSGRFSFLGAAHQLEVSMLTQTQRAAFDRDGLIRLPGAVPRDDALGMATRIREFLATEDAIRLNGEDEDLAQRPGGFQSLARAGAFDRIDVSAIPAALDDLFGSEGWERPPHWGRPLVTYKVSDQPWDVPTSSSWHIHQRTGADGILQRVNIFVVLSTLRPRGGGTLFLTGSHRLIAEFSQHGAKTKALRRILGERDPWLAGLWGSTPAAPFERRTRYLDAGVVIDGISLNVVEATGEPGDTYLMRTDIFHCAAPNALDEPRIMLVGGVSRLAERDG